MHGQKKSFNVLNVRFSTEYIITLIITKMSANKLRPEDGQPLLHFMSCAIRLNSVYITFEILQIEQTGRAYFYFSANKAELLMDHIKDKVGQVKSSQFYLYIFFYLKFTTKVISMGNSLILRKRLLKQPLVKL